MAKLTDYASVVNLNETMYFYTAIDTDADSVFESRKTSMGSIRARLLFSPVTDAATAEAFAYDTDNALTTAGAKLASWSNNATEKFSIDKDGDVTIDSGYFLSGVADGASAEAFVLDTAALSTTGAKAFVIKNNGTEIFSVDKDGSVSVGLQLFQTEAGMTAYATGGQANATAITKSINEFSTVATAGDSCKLPAAAAGLRVYIINNGAASMDVFPASGDDLGAGTDTAVPLAATNTIEFICYDTTNWRQV